jgi:hypothetical protein
MRTLIALLLTATAAHAETPCLPTLKAYAAALAEGWGETAQAGGTMQRGGVLMVFANPLTGTWTIVIQSPDGRYCSPASGTDYGAVKPGEPA